MEDQNIDRPLHDLVVNDVYYKDVAARLGNPNERNESGYTLLHAAACSTEANPRIVQLLLDRKADVDSAAGFKFTPLHFAVTCRNRNAVAALIEAGASINLGDVFGRTALHFSISKTWHYPPIPAPILPCDMWIVKRLLSQPDIDLDALDEAGGTTLLWAVRGKNADAVKALLKRGANPNIPNAWDETPLDNALAFIRPNSRIVCALLSKGARIYCENRFGRTPMDLFIRNLPANDVAKRVVWSLVLRYRVRGSLVQGLKRNRVLYRYFKRCCREVESMKRQIVYEKFTLHDFACDCFHLRVDDPQRDIYIPVVEILFSGSYTVYLDFILRRMTTRDLRSILVMISGIPWMDDLYVNAMHMNIFYSIKFFYMQILCDGYPWSK